MAYKCYIGGLLMPETPGKLTIKIKGQNSTLVLLNGDEINFLKSPGLSEITLPLTFPMLTGANRPEYYLNHLEKLKLEKAPTQFIMTRTSPAGALLFDTNIKVSIEDYNIAENATNGLDLSVDVKLKQYRDYSTKTVTITTTASTTTPTGSTNAKTATIANTRSATTAPKATTYTVQKGDSLWAISKKYLGSGAKYMQIYNANTDKIKNPNLIYPGQILVMPK